DVPNETEPNRTQRRREALAAGVRRLNPWRQAASNTGGREEKKGAGGPGGPEGPKKPQPPGAQPSRGLFGFISILLLVVLLFMLFTSAQQGTTITLAEFETRWETGAIEPHSVVIGDSAITAMAIDPA